jgi:ABC-type lipoprotein release transport system permease subunit
VDAVQIGLYEADSSYVYLPFGYVRDLIGQTGQDGRKECLASVQIRPAPGFAEETVKQQVREAWKSYAKTELGWSDLEVRKVAIYSSSENERVKMFTHEIRKQLGVMQMMMGLICLVTALLVFVTLFMIVMQKRRDMGIIRSLGSSRSGLAMIFMYYGLSIGVAGTALGLLLGVTATRHINLLEATLTRLLGFKVWKSGVYMFSHIPDEVAWDSVGWILAAGIGTAMLGALLPALRAARLRPVENLRYE